MQMHSAVLFWLLCSACNDAANELLCAMQACTRCGLTNPTTNPKWRPGPLGHRHLCNGCEWPLTCIGCRDCESLSCMFVQLYCTNSLMARQSMTTCRWDQVGAPEILSGEAQRSLKI